LRTYGLVSEPISFMVWAGVGRSGPL